MKNVYISSEIAEQIKMVARSKGIAINTMLDEIALGKNTMTNFKTSMPKADNLAKIADYLDVSVDYLLGRTSESNVNNGYNLCINSNIKAAQSVSNGDVNVSLNSNEADEMIIELVKAFKTLPFAERIKILNDVLEKQKNQKI